jgi:hypothetical protein
LRDQVTKGETDLARTCAQLEARREELALAESKVDDAGHNIVLKQGQLSTLDQEISAKIADKDAL